MESNPPLCNKLDSNLHNINNIILQVQHCIQQGNINNKNLSKIFNKLQEVGDLLVDDSSVRDAIYHIYFLTLLVAAAEH
jgi:hypothetical protein